MVLRSMGFVPALCILRYNTGLASGRSDRWAMTRQRTVSKRHKSSPASSSIVPGSAFVAHVIREIRNRPKAGITASLSLQTSRSPFSALGGGLVGAYNPAPSLCVVQLSDWGRNSPTGADDLGWWPHPGEPAHAVYQSAENALP